MFSPSTKQQLLGEWFTQRTVAIECKIPCKRAGEKCEKNLNAAK